MSFNITSANAESVFSVEKLFPSGIILEQYSTDQSISHDSVQVVETRMGVDGKMVAGYIPAVQVVTINLEASSPSLKYFNQLYDAMVTGRTIYICNLVCTVPSISTVFKFLNGVLQTGAPFPAHKKILDATSWTYHFERMERSAL